MENININTLRFLSVLNGLAEKSKSGILPLDAYNGTQTGIIYDPSIEFEERGDASIKVHPVVSAIGFPDGVREVCYYGEDDEDAINEEFQVFVEVDSCPPWTTRTSPAPCTCVITRPRPSSLAPCPGISTNASKSGMAIGSLPKPQGRTQVCVRPSIYWHWEILCYD